jgi:hypothetical protein
LQVFDVIITGVNFQKMMRSKYFSCSFYIQYLNYNAINVIIEEEICKMYILMQHKKLNITNANIECKNCKKNIYFSSFFENLRL